MPGILSGARAGAHASECYGPQRPLKCRVLSKRESNRRTSETKGKVMRLPFVILYANVLHAKLIQSNFMLISFVCCLSALRRCSHRFVPLSFLVHSLFFFFFVIYDSARLFTIFLPFYTFLLSGKCELVADKSDSDGRYHSPFLIFIILRLFVLLQIMNFSCNFLLMLLLLLFPRCFIFFSSLSSSSTSILLHFSSYFFFSKLPFVVLVYGDENNHRNAKFTTK